MTEETPVMPLIVVLYCSRTATGELQGTTAEREVKGVRIRTVMMPCSSKVQVHELLRLLADGADGVELVACAEEACRYLVGSRMAEKRVERAKGLLTLAGVTGERLGLTRRTGVTEEGLMELGMERARVLEASAGSISKGEDR